MRKHFTSLMMAFAMWCLFAGIAQAQFAETPPPGFLSNNPMPIPVLLPGPNFRLDMVESMHSFWPGQTPVMSMAYQTNGNNNSWLGPTLVWNRGTTANIVVNNFLSDTTTTHWHGAHIPAQDDGGPHQFFAPMDSFTPSFPIIDSSATQWYHPHLHHETFMQVQMGLAGLVLVKDAQDPYENQLPHSYGVDDIPIIVQDRHFWRGQQGTEDYQIDTLCSVGDVFIVNGKLRPTLNLPAQQIRFRVLSAGSERSFNIGFRSGNGTTLPSYQIATDAGYLAEKIPNQAVLLGVGERAELTIDLTGMDGDTIYLGNFAGLIPADFPGGPSLNNPPCFGPVGQTGPAPDLGNYSSFQDSNTTDILRIIVGPPVGTPGIVPQNFANYQLAVPNGQVDVVRNKKFTNWGGPHDAPPPFQIDNTPFRMEHVNDWIRLGDIEKWSFKNQTGTTHPLHIHDVHFFITEIRDTASGQNMPIPAYLQGPKDVMMARSGYKYTFITQFLDFGINSYSADSAYMYHCHILPHEDGVMPQPGDTTFNGGMMHQFVVLDSNFYDATYVAREDAVKPITWSTYPNPTEDKVYLRGECRKPSTIQVVAMDGKVIQRIAAPAIHGDYEIPIERLPTGMYFLEWLRPDGSATRKLIVK